MVRNVSGNREREEKEPTNTNENKRKEKYEEMQRMNGKEIVKKTESEKKWMKIKLELGRKSASSWTRAMQMKAAFSDAMM